MSSKFKSETEKIRAEVLVVLDYLANHTDENHPATQLDICRYARKYGFKFNDDRKNHKGDDIKRQRVADILAWLKDLGDKYPDEFPLIIEKDPKKYYVEKKNFLNIDEAAKVIAALENDKYTTSAYLAELEEKLLDVFGSSDDNKNLIRQKVKYLNKGVSKYSQVLLKKIAFLEKALSKNALVNVNIKVKGKPTDVWCKVCLIKDYKNSTYVLLLPTKNINASENYIFEDVEKVNICPNKFGRTIDDSEDTIKDYYDTEKLFKQLNPELAKKHKTLENFINNRFDIKYNDITRFIFTFNLKDLRDVKNSFESYFKKPFAYELYNPELLSRGVPIVTKSRKEAVVSDEDLARAKNGIVSVLVGKKDLKQWVLSQYKRNSFNIVNDIINVRLPSHINEEVALYYYDKTVNNIRELPRPSQDRLLKILESRDSHKKLNNKINIMK